MSLNWTQISPTELKPVPLPDEKFVYTIELVDITVVVPPTLQGPKTTLRASGKIWLSNQRLVFLSPTAALPPPPPTDSSASSPASSAVPVPAILQSSYSYLSSLLPATSSSPQQNLLHSLSVPLLSLHSQKFNQPLFSPPSVSIQFTPTPEGGFAGGAREIELDVAVKEGKAWEFSEALEKVRERAGRRPRRAEEGEGLPAYPGSV